LVPLVRGHYPRLQLVVHEDQTQHLVQRLRNFEIDAALLALPLDGEDFEERALFDEPFWSIAAIDIWNRTERVCVSCQAYPSGQEQSMVTVDSAAIAERAGYGDFFFGRVLIELKIKDCLPSLGRSQAQTRAPAAESDTGRSRPIGMSCPYRDLSSLDALA